MDTEIRPITRETIAQQVRHAISLGTEDVNIYAGTEHEAAWDATVQRLSAVDVPESEGGA